MQVIYDPAEVSYEQLLDTFFAHVDPTTKNRQGNDVGSQYRSAIFWHHREQKSAAEKVTVPSSMSCTAQGKYCSDGAVSSVSVFLSQHAAHIK
jgi:peptide-methionine (S)-S-oxide reductase